MNRFSKALFSLAFLAIYLTTASGFAQAEGPSRPITIAHRGANRLADENTLKAYALAAEHGMDFIECDPRLTKDGVFVIMHDSNAKRTTGVDAEIPEMTLEQIKALRTKGGEEIPTLKETLLLAKEKGLRVYLDIKEKGEEKLDQLMKLVEATGMSGRVVAGIWHASDERWMQKNYPQIATSVPYPAPYSSMKQAKKMGASWIGTLAEYATEPIVKESVKRGMPLVTMPINDPDVIREKIMWGLSVVQTDDIVMLEKLLKGMGLEKQEENSAN